MSQRYQWAKGARVKADANEVGVVFEELQARNEVLDEHEVLVAARNVNSPMHDCFEWDNTKAAYEHRLSQARYLIRKLCVVVQDDPKAQPIRAYVSIQKPDEVDRDYVAVSRVMNSDDLLAEACQTLLKKLEGITLQYQHFVRVATILRATREQLISLQVEVELEVNGTEVKVARAEVQDAY